jgi:hypothetical protein
MRSRQRKQTPLETLVISQLAAIRRDEAALQTRLTSSAAAPANVAAELSKLQISTDRLSRMIDAMS